jgi:thioredoxin reductase
VRVLIVGAGIGCLSAAIVRRSRHLGWVAQLKNPLLCQLCGALLRTTPDRMLLEQPEEVVAYEV